MGRKDLIGPGRENIWGGKHLRGLDMLVEENIWGRKDLIDRNMETWGKHFGDARFN